MDSGFTIPGHELTTAEFVHKSITSNLYMLERTASGRILATMKGDWRVGLATPYLSWKIAEWASSVPDRGHCRHGVGVYLPNGAVYEAKISYATAEQDQSMKGCGDDFLHFVPVFIVEFILQGDRLGVIQDRMNEWIENGAQIVWLIDADHRRVFVYEAGKEPRLCDGETIVGAGIIDGLQISLVELWDRYNFKH